MQLADFLTRNALAPALRLARDHLAANPDYREIRKWVARIDQAYPKQPHDAQLREVDIGAIKATWIDPAGARKDRAILYLHGGAFIIETPRIHAGLAARLGAQAQARALMPSYRLAPEFPCPAALDDCLAAYRFLLQSGFAAKQIMLAGDSAGGTLALSLLLRARDEGLPLPAGAVVLSPATDGTMSGDSMHRNDGNDPMFAPSLFHALAPLYLRDESLRTHPHVSPLHGDLRGLPPILILVGSTELLLDDSVRFACKCPSAALQVWHDMPHVFPLFHFLPEAADAAARIGRFVRECLADEVAHADAAARGATTGADQVESGAVPAQVPAIAQQPDRAAPELPTRPPGLRLTLALLSPRARLTLALVVLGACAIGFALGVSAAH